MKQSNLISILILFFSLLSVQSVVGITKQTTNTFQDGSLYYTTYNDYKTPINVHSNFGEKELKIELLYPVNNIKFDAQTNKAFGSYIRGTITITDNNNNTIFSDHVKNNNDLNKPITTNPQYVTFKQTFKTGDGANKIDISDVRFTIAPHIIMKTKSVNFMFNLSDEGPNTQKDVEFHSFLTAGTLKYSIVNEDGTPNTYFTLHETKTVGSNTFCSTSDDANNQYNRTQYTFKVSFNPSENIDGYYYARIKITDGTSTEYVDLSGYKYNLNLRWEQELPELTVDEPFELIANTYDDNGNGPIAKEISVTYTWSPVDALSIIYPEKPKEAYPIITPNKSYESVTITAIKKGNTYYNSSNTIEKTIKIKPADQSLIWEDFELTTADKNITITDILCQSTKADLLNLIGETITYTSSNSNVVEINNNNTLTVHKYGEAVTITATQDGKEGYINPASATKTINPKIGTIRFDNNNGNGNWDDETNWMPINSLNKARNVAPSAVVNAEIAAEAKISSTNREEINNLTFVENGKLTIGATSGLKANKITNENAENLILKASDKGNATLIYADGTPSATVEMHSKAKYGTKDTDGHHPEWQYMGVAVKGAKVGDFKYNDSRNAWLLEWTESQNTTGDPWSKEPLVAGTALEAWAGYSITQPDTTTYTMSGQLMNGDHTYTLTRTIKEGADKQDADCGFNLLANSYTAPIDITKLDTSNFVNADACIVLYNTGTYAQWESQQGKSGQNPGQLTVIPVEAAKAISEEQSLPTTIPSMQAFFVMAKEGGGTFTVDYETAVLGATNTGNQMRAPEMRDEFNVLKIMIKGENSRDQLFLLENENTSKAYDNGYEARKIFDAPRGHQMYATCEYGYASIDCSKSFIGQAIGLKGDNEGEKLTISFGIDKIKDYESLFLYDKATGKYVNIMAEEEYTFYGIRGADDNRFTIVTNPDDSNQTPPFVVIGNELAFDRAQIGTDNANIYIYDTLGRLLMTDKVNPSENYRIPDMPEGIYLVSMNGYTTKIVRK